LVNTIPSLSAKNPVPKIWGYKGGTPEGNLLNFEMNPTTHGLASSNSRVSGLVFKLRLLTFLRCGIAGDYRIQCAEAAGGSHRLEEKIEAKAA
jgi:hypothetical protein